MGASIELRSDFDGPRLRELAKRSRDGAQARRLLALAEIYDGRRRSDAARLAGVGLQIIRDWVVRFNAEGPDGLFNRKGSGPPSRLDDVHRAALKQAVEEGPKPYLDGPSRRLLANACQAPVVRWPLAGRAFACKPREAAGRSCAMGARGVRRQRQPPNPRARTARYGLSPPVEIWFQDDARIGQKNKITRPLSANACIRLPGSGWAKRGSRPRAPHDQRMKWAYIFGAICPAEGKSAGLVMPWADTHAMAEHLKLISAEVTPGAHAILIVDQAGWHTTSKLDVPENITLVPLPPRSPELNPVENLWQFIRQNWLSNRVFKNYDDIVALCCESWNKIIDQPWRIRSIGHRDWAHGF